MIQYLGGSRFTTTQQNNHHLGATTNSHETSMDNSSGHYSSVQEFNPANCDLKPVERNHTNRRDIHEDDSFEGKDLKRE